MTKDHSATPASSVQLSTRDRRAILDKVLAALEKRFYRPEKLNDRAEVRPVHLRLLAGEDLQAQKRLLRLAEAESVPVRIVNLTDAEALEAQLVDNLIRADVHPMSSAPNHWARNSPATLHGLRKDEVSLDGAIHGVVDHLETKLLCLPVIAIQAQHLADGSASRLTLNVDDEVDGFADLSLNVLKRCLLVNADLAQHLDQPAMRLRVLSRFTKDCELLSESRWCYLVLLRCWII